MISSFKKTYFHTAWSKSTNQQCDAFRDDRLFNEKKKERLN